MFEDPLKPHEGQHKSLKRKAFARVVIEYPNGKTDYEIQHEETVKDVIAGLVRVNAPLIYILLFNMN
jgi:hypothetical protein